MKKNNLKQTEAVSVAGSEEGIRHCSQKTEKKKHFHFNTALKN
jgi:hypothetical protein